MGVLFSNNSKKQLKKLNSRIQQKIIFTLEKFEKGRQVEVIKLKNKEEEFRIRTGNYRIQVKKIDKGYLVIKIGKRENFYGVLF
jgi:mRNA-degrading endonuclease RelE of RelBE toxin-antitoxin system